MLGRLAALLAPRLVWRRRVTTWKIETGEDEAVLLPVLAVRSKVSIDVGAAEGAYTAALIPLSLRVIAFEPAPVALRQLHSMLHGTRIVSIEEIALSDQDGEVEMRSPPDLYWRSTIEPRNELRYTPNLATIRVQRRQLDEYALEDVGFIKVDVEGHEMAVLIGAVQTIKRSRPNIMVEVEERHYPGSLSAVRNYFSNLHYAGFFLASGEILPLLGFDPEVHQNVSNLNEKGQRCGPYINNLIFVPAERSVAWQRAANSRVRRSTLSRS